MHRTKNCAIHYCIISFLTSRNFLISIKKKKIFRYYKIFKPERIYLTSSSSRKFRPKPEKWHVCKWKMPSTETELWNSIKKKRFGVILTQHVYMNWWLTDTGITYPDLNAKTAKTALIFLLCLQNVITKMLYIGTKLNIQSYNILDDLKSHKILRNTSLSSSLSWVSGFKFNGNVFQSK